jgi:hypothetical protein
LANHQPTNFCTEIIERLRDMSYIGWRWGLSDVRRAARLELEKLGSGADAVLEWSKRFAAKRRETEESVAL